MAEAPSDGEPKWVDTLPGEVWVNIINRVGATDPETAIRFACSCRGLYSLQGDEGFCGLKSKIRLNSIFKTLPGISEGRLYSLRRLYAYHKNLDAGMLLATYEGWYNKRPNLGVMLLDKISEAGHVQSIYNANIMFRSFETNTKPKVGLAAFKDNTPLLQECRQNLREMLNSAVLTNAPFPRFVCDEFDASHISALEYEVMHDSFCEICALDMEASSNPAV